MKTIEEFLRERFKLGGNDFKSNTLHEKVLTNGEVLEAIKEYSILILREMSKELKN
jgi:hypothetical protein